MRIGIHKFLIFVFVVEMAFIVFFLLNYAMATMNSENFLTHAWILENGTAFKAEDFSRSLNIDMLERDPHRLSRPIANFVEVVNAKFRSNLWTYVPPHPSLSILWPLLLIGLPWALFNFFRNIGCCPNVALAGVCVYVTSVGYLFPIVALHRPSKGLVNIMAVAVLYVGSVLYRRIRTTASGGITSGLWAGYIGLLFLIFLSFFCDETGLFVYVLCAIWFFPGFLRTRSWKWMLSVFLTLPLLYYLCVFHLLPWIHHLVRGHWVDMNSFFAMPKSSSFQWGNFWTNVAWLMNEHPHLQLNIKGLLNNNPPLFTIQVVYSSMLLIMFLLFIKSVIAGQRAMYGNVLKAVACAIAFYFFHTIQLSNNAKTWGVWWYGSLYSLVYVLVFTSILNVVVEHISLSKEKVLRWPFLVFVGIVVLHGMAFSMRRVDIFFPRKETEGLTISQVFEGDLGDYYRKFDMADILRRADCRRKFVWDFWRHTKGLSHKDAFESEAPSCAKILTNDQYFAHECLYLHTELN